MKFLEALTAIRAEDSKLTEQEVAVGQLTVEPDGLHAAGERVNLTGKGFEQLCARFRRRGRAGGAGVVPHFAPEADLHTTAPPPPEWRPGRGRHDRSPRPRYGSDRDR